MADDDDLNSGDNNEDGNIYSPPRSKRRIPPPEAFQPTDGEFLHKEPEKNTITSRSAAPQRPSLLIRRPSSLFSQLPVRTKSRLLSDIDCSQTDATAIRKNYDSDNSVVPETAMDAYSQSQSTWLQEDRQSTLGSQSQAKERSGEQQERRSSLFGAVMQKFGSGMKSSFPMQPSSPSKTTATANGAFQSLIASPSGKTIMNIVNQFHSPFKFQSPTSSHKLRQKRRRLWSSSGGSDDDNNVNIKGDGDAFHTPKKRRWMELGNVEEDDSKPSSSNLFSDVADSRSSLSGAGRIDDESWREAPIVDTPEGATSRMEILDWSLPTKIRIEVHGAFGQQRNVHSWIMNLMQDNEEALTYWIYKSPWSPSSDKLLPQSSALTTAISNTNSSSLLQKNKSSMSRQVSVGSRFDSKKANNDASSSFANQQHPVAKYLIQSVRGPHSKFSRKNLIEDHCWWGEQATVHEDSHHAHNLPLREWQQATQSLFSNYRRRALQFKTTNNSSAKALVLETYFYCIGQDHSVLFRTEAAAGSNAIVPVVLVSSTSESFRKLLDDNGMSTDTGTEKMRWLESIPEREASERKKITAAIQKNKRLFNKAVLMSPGVKADLEALRRAQAFGESAGADVFVKVDKKLLSVKDDDAKKILLPKALRISGWDNVSLFFEVYRNRLGDVMGTNEAMGRSTLPNQRLPLLLCPNTEGLCQFEHASMKQLRFFPVEVIPVESSGNQGGTVGTSERHSYNGNSIDVSGILLPCTIRKLLLLTRKKLLEDENHFSFSKQKTQVKDEPDSSRYVVLHSTRSKPTRASRRSPQSFAGGVSGTLLFNQGKRRRIKSGDTDNDYGEHMFECSYGKVVSMAVWDTSREEVAACKLDSAFPDDWFNKS